MVQISGKLMVMSKHKVTPLLSLAKFTDLFYEHNKQVLLASHVRLKVGRGVTKFPVKLIQTCELPTKPRSLFMDVEKCCAT